MLGLSLGDGEHARPVQPLVEPARHHLAQYAGALAPGPFPRDHQNASAALLLREGDETAELVVSFLLGEAVQIELALDRKLPAAQTLRQPPVHIGDAAD